MSIRQYWFVLWELTKRELKRKYARSFLGILWSCVYPLMRMALVVVLFSTIFNKGIEKYPAYYFVGFLMFEFFATATQTSLTWYYLMIPVVLLLLLIFTVGMSYAVSIWFVFQRDAMNIYSNFIFILRFFVAMFYSVEWVADGVKWVIQHNPLYAYIYVMRQCVVYGQWPETMYLVQMVAWAFGMLAFGILIFKKYENDVVERL